jgi:hypothetical protein
MTDFVTRLEDELHAAALRQERRGRVGTATIPRLRIVLGGLPTAALATVLLGLAIAVSALILSGSPQQRSAGDLPAALRGTWRAPPAELRLYDARSSRCVNLGLDSSSACYTLGDSGSRVATEWGDVEVAGRTLTLHSRQRAAGTGSYRWRLEAGRLRLRKISDRNRERATALVAMPMAFARSPDRHPGVPTVWAAQLVTSPRFGYSLHVPHFWSIDTRGPADLLSGDSSRHALPEVSVTAHALPAENGVSSGCRLYDRRDLMVGGMRIRVSVYRHCGAPNVQSATFVHGGRAYRITWRGKASRPERDYTRFDALLETLTFAP